MTDDGRNGTLPLAAARLDDPAVREGRLQRARLHLLHQSCKEILPNIEKTAVHEERRRIEDVDHDTDGHGKSAHGPVNFTVRGETFTDDLVDFDAAPHPLGDHARQGGVGGERLETAAIAAATGATVRIDHGMAEFSGKPAAPLEKTSSAEDAEAESGGNDTFAVIGSGVVEGDTVLFRLPGVTEETNPFSVIRAGIGGGFGGGFGGGGGGVRGDGGGDFTRGGGR